MRVGAPGQARHDARLGEGPAVVAAAGQWEADGREQAAFGVDDDLQVGRVPVVLAGRGDAAVAGGHQGGVDDVDGVLAGPARGRDGQQRCEMVQDTVGRGLRDSDSGTTCRNARFVRQYAATSNTRSSSGSRHGRPR